MKENNQVELEANSEDINWEEVNEESCENASLNDMCGWKELD